MKHLLKFSSLVLAAILFAASCKDKNVDNTTDTIDRENLQGTFTSGTVDLTSGTYKLTGPLVIDNGVTLNISAGVIIEAQSGGTGQYIVIKQGGKINAQGTATSPIVMTATTKAQASWGGLVLCGKATINKGATAQAEVTGFVYGGTDDADNSGTIKYVRVEYAGAKINSDKEFNGITFFGVGSGTTVDYLESYKSSDDGVECFGGTVVLNHLICIDSEDDGFDWTEGWRGGINNGYASVANITNASDDSRGIEADNWDGGFTATPYSNPTLTNLSLIARSAAATSGSQKEGIKFRRGTKGKVTNVYIYGYTTGINVEHDETIASWVAGSLSVNSPIQILGTTKLLTTTTTAVAPATTGTTTDLSSTITTATATGAGSAAAFPSWGAGWARQ